MPPPEPPDRASSVIFVHTEKTGGMSFLPLVARQFLCDAICNVNAETLQALGQAIA